MINRVSQQSMVLENNSKYCALPGRCHYAMSLDKPGGVLLRPWQLGFRADFGLPGLQEPEEVERLIELILTETCSGFENQISHSHGPNC